MKTFIAILFFATNAFAYELDAPSAFLAIVYPGTYSGRTESGEACGISVNSNANGVVVTGWDSSKTESKFIANGSSYRWNPGQRFYLQSDIDSFGHNNNTKESLVRTIAVTEKTQYVVVGHGARVNGNLSESFVVCIINL